MSSSKSHFGELERAVMDVLWELPRGASATVRDVHAHLSHGRDIAYTTVMTVMARLARKKFVTQVKDGRAYRYRAHTSRASMTAELMRGTLDDMADADRGSALVAFVDRATPDDVAALKSALAALGH